MQIRVRYNSEEIRNALRQSLDESIGYDIDAATIKLVDNEDQEITFLEAIVDLP